MNKKGQGFGLFLFFFIAVAILLGLGLLLVIGSSVLNYTFDIIQPTVSGIGEVGSANFTEISQYSIDPLNTVVQSFTWFSGVLYMICMLSLFGMAIAFRTTMSRWLIPMFIIMAFLMIILSIFISNAYQDIYQTNDDISTVMHEHTMLNYMILHSPLFFTVIIFISGIILFSGMQQEDFV